MNNSITLSQALEGYELSANARHLSKNTIAEYQNTYRHLQKYLVGDPAIDSITVDQLQKFLASLTVSKKTVLNYHIGLSALWTWAKEKGFVDTNLVQSIEAPKPEKKEIIPFTEKELHEICNAVRWSKLYTRPGKKACKNQLKDGDRNYAIILVLVDTGVRASELCALKINNADLRNNDKSIHVIGGKGDKSRRIPISSRTATAIWKYLTSRPEARLNEPLFATDTGRVMDRNNLGNMLDAAGERSDVPDVHPHRFRHTFAINYLRNGGDIYTLQRILGHETLEMCLRYLAIAQADIDRAHRSASPVDHWAL